MAGIKRLYDVYKTEYHRYNGMGEDREITTFMGRTMAVSEKQAANNVAHRNGETPCYTVPWRGDGCRDVLYTAKPAVG